MSQQQAKAFLNTVAEDKELEQEATDAIGIDPQDGTDSEAIINDIIDQIVVFAGGKDYDFTAEEYKAAFIESKKENGELSEEELDNVAGGGFFDTLGDAFHKMGDDLYNGAKKAGTDLAKDGYDTVNNMLKPY
jgi:hypothetical protein